MKLKACFLSIVFFVGGCSLADAIINRGYYSSGTTQPTSIIYTNVNSNLNNESYISAIEEIKDKISKTPNDYVLYVSLIDMYLKTKQYDKAYEKLVFLNNLALNNKIDSSVKSALNTTYNDFKKYSKYEKNKSLCYIDMAMIMLVLSNNQQAEDLISLASDFSFSESKLLIDAFKTVFSTTQNTDKAILIAEKILVKNPMNTDVRKLKASYFLQTNNIEEAIKEYSIIVELIPSDLDSKYFLYKLLKSKNSSEKDIIKALYKSDKPDYEQVYNEMAQMLLNNSDYSGAKYYINLLIEKYPDNANGYILLSDICRKEGKLKESYEALNKLREKADSNEAIAKYNVLLAKLSDEPVKEANSLIATGLYQQAIEVLEGANQESLYVILTQSRAYYLLKNKQKTFELLNKAMSLYPDNTDVYCAFGYIYLKEKDIESARKYVNRSLSLNQNNKTAIDLLDMVNKAEADKSINQIISSFEAQNYTETMRLIDNALKINPKDPVLYYYKALTYISLNNYAASTALLYKSIELDKNNIPAYFYLGLAFDNLSEPENALMYYQKFIQLLPADDYGESEKLEYAKNRVSKLK